MIFENRAHAGERLADEFLGRNFKNPIVMGIPRGGILVAERLASRFSWQLDLLLPRMLPIPFNPEAGFGVVTTDGTVTLNDEILWEITLKQEQIDRITEEQLKEARRLQRFYRGSRKKPVLKRRELIVVDDGSSDAFTLLAAVRAMRNQAPSRLLLASPVIPFSAFEKIGEHADEIVAVLVSKSWRFALGSFYTELRNIEAEEARATLRSAWKRKR